MSKKKKWTHVRVSCETHDRLKLLSCALGAPISVIVGIFAEEGVKSYEADWQARGEDGEELRAGEPAAAHLQPL